MKNRFRTVSLIFTLILLVSSFVSCSANSEKSAYDMAAPEVYAETNYTDFDMVEAEEKGYGDYGYSYEKSESSSASVTDTRKIIKTVALNLETKAFNAAVEQIRSSCIAAGGYMEYSFVSGDSIESSGRERNASFIVRIPAQGLDAYCNSLGGDSFNVLSRTENSSDITDTYYDTEARLKSLQTQEERLLSMLEGATELEYMLEIENTLADVRYEIESYYSTIKRYDSQVSLSTVSIELQEVIEYKPETVVPLTFGERVSNAFGGTWENFADDCQNFAVGFVWSIPTLLVWAIIITIIIFIVRAILKKRKAKKAADDNK